MLSSVYGRVATARRAWYARRDHRRLRLPCPVVSVGNLVVGGSGKTPLVAHLARGERPAVLSRGYARRVRREGVVVVSDGQAVRVSAAEAGDEPYMLAQALTGVSVLVCEDRFVAGQMAAEQLGATTFILDDGFQHVQLARDVDLLLVDSSDLRESVLPSGRLREPLSSARVADAVVVPASEQEAGDVAGRLGVPTWFRLESQYGSLRCVRPAKTGAGVAGAEAPGLGRPVLAVSGIARPERFRVALTQLGWVVADHVAHADHHWFSDADVAGAEERAVKAGASAIITTEKDAVRLAASATSARVPWFVLPMTVTVLPAATFASWLGSRLDQARQRESVGR
jgi:tetraacyldisaccharide 4'-kinase